MARSNGQRAAEAQPLISMGTGLSRTFSPTPVLVVGLGRGGGGKVYRACRAGMASAVGEANRHRR